MGRIYTGCGYPVLQHRFLLPSNCEIVAGLAAIEFLVNHLTTNSQLHIPSIKINTFPN
ncbi:hypothetical protein CASFOL_038299 [Castilleja foliolosa]|uniref:Uncharacterized protein n=1 Tax=Castilleja foliolosa TaxID=1961234 RepID=A0ABD3BKK7_9LAMI